MTLTIKAFTEQCCIPVILDKSNLGEHDVLLDLRAGTGTLAENIKREAKLTHNKYHLCGAK